MFRSAEIGHRLSKAAYHDAVPGLRATIELLPTDVEAHIDDPKDAM